MNINNAINTYQKINSSVPNLTPEQKNKLEDKVIDKKENVQSNIESKQLEKRELYSDVYSYSLKKSQMDIYMENTDSKDNDFYKNINIDISVQRDLDNKEKVEPYNQYRNINEIV
jgi:hypothetical protein